MHYQDPTRKKGLSGWIIGLIACGGCMFLFIPITAAILFPVFAKAREAAKKANCQSNMKELALAAAMYRNDFDGKLFCSGPGGADRQFETTLGAGGARDSWEHTVRKYVRDTQVFTCSSDSRPATVIDTSYHYKHAVNLATKAGLKEQDFKYPYAQMLFYERQSFHWGGGPIADGASLNVAFLDGHVQTVRMSSVAPDTEPTFFNVVDPGAPAAAARKPYWDPRYCQDRLP